MGEITKSIQKQECTVMKPSGRDICIGKNECEKQANICMETNKQTIIWGYVTDSCGRPIEDAMVRLFKYTDEVCLKSICYTFTDENGFYQLSIKNKCEGKYHVLVVKCNCEGEDVDFCKTEESRECSQIVECDCSNCRRCGQNVCCRDMKKKSNKIKYCY